VDFGSVTVVTKLRAGRLWNRGLISEGGADDFLFLPSRPPLGPTQPPVRYVPGVAAVDH
jgi:hypothetical protein